MKLLKHKSKYIFGAFAIFVCTLFTFADKDRTTKYLEATVASKVAIEKVNTKADTKTMYDYLTEVAFEGK